MMFSFFSFFFLSLYLEKHVQSENSCCPLILSCYHVVILFYLVIWLSPLAFNYIIYVLVYIVNFKFIFDFIFD